MLSGRGSKTAQNTMIAITSKHNVPKPITHNQTYRVLSISDTPDMRILQNLSQAWQNVTNKHAIGAVLNIAPAAAVVVAAAEATAIAITIIMIMTVIIMNNNPSSLWMSSLSMALCFAGGFFVKILTNCLDHIFYVVFSMIIRFRPPKGRNMRKKDRNVWTNIEHAPK